MADSLTIRPSKRRRVSPSRETTDGSNGNDTKIQKQFFKTAANWNLEQSYEERSRKGKKKDARKAAAEGGRLPARTAGGTWTVKEEDAASVASDSEWLEGEDNEDAEPEEAEAAPEEPQIPEKEQIRRAQEELAKVATQLNEDPEEYPGAFKAMSRIGDSQIMAIKKICMVTQMTVYKDVIPGYRIRPATEEAGEKLSKEVKRLRTYEQALVTGYQGYIKKLAHFAASPSADTSKRGQPISSIAITCACTLVNSVPHFNFRGELLRILVKKLSTRKVDADFIKCREALETLFKEDEEGNASMEAVSLLSKMMKAKEYRVDESVLNTFLHLRLLGEFAGKASQDRAERPSDGFNGKKLKQKKQFRTKLERKLMKEQKEAEKVMAHADAAVSHEEREKMQSETLKMVFATYFRVLKERVPHLMGAVLEGLAQYAHLINQDFFGDLLEALKQLIRYSEVPEEEEDEDKPMADGDDEEEEIVRDTSRESLLCTVTAFALLEGQDAHNARTDLHLDLSYFITHLYRGLVPLSVNPDLELGAKSLHLSDPNDESGSTRRDTKINVQTTTVLLMRCLSGVLLPPWNIRSVPPLRLAAFTKQLMSVALQLPEKSCQAMLGLLGEVVHTHGRKVNSLWNTEERKMDGTFKPLAETVEGSNPFATTIWEGELLKKHYCPKVREELKAMEKELRNL
ncbi:nucleolar complex-associated protein-domain-containing protein [Triangularia verruculosa]|uniref:Nucleolar complex-associated protein 3 n=1 Tax=Triangularia verruculosa TaxID=2587418 RepID=A0AAN6X9K8_9PEZI|nr:nucleolar complex-associated protein-domain-containing protein [Triangularia verruculosa]